MVFTVGRRIASALSLELVLLAIVTAIGAVALGRVTATYERALAVRRSTVVPALRTESEIRAANVEQLRFLLTGEAQYASRRDSVVAIVRQLMGQLSDTAADAAMKGRWNTASALLAQWNDGMVAAAKASTKGQTQEVLRIRSTETEPLRQRLDTIIRGGVLDAQRRADEVAAEGMSTAANARNTVLVTAVLAIFIGIVGAVVLSRSINGPLQDTANVIAASSAQILAATTEQAAGTNESMAAVTETVATVDEVAQTAAQSSQRARNVADAAQRASEGGRAGRQAVEDSVAAMQLVQDQVETMARSIVALAEQAQAIGEITTAVSDIAEQTKLLALNAAVESTRAGEHGRGFALVAAEIKALAGEAKESTVQVRKLLSDIQRATSAAVMATEQGTKQTVAAVRQVKQAGTVIAQLASVVDEAAQSAAQIVGSAGQQALGMDQIRQAIANIHDATQQSLTATRQSETAAQNLNELGTRLVDLVGARARA